jgi:predicted dehydrogenase
VRETRFLRETGFLVKAWRLLDSIRFSNVQSPIMEDRSAESPLEAALRVGVIGVGALGRHHARLLSEMPGARLAGVADPNAAQGRNVADACGCRWFADYRELLDAEPLDAVSIVVPTAHHRAVAEECLRRNIPVLVEKPITPTLKDGDALCRLAEERNLPLQVGHIERFNPAFQALRERTAAPKYIRAERLAPYSFRSTDVSVAHDLMIHDLDLALALTPSPVVRVEAFGACVFGGHADIVQARVAFEDGCIADFTANRVNPFARRTMQVWSETGCWTADFQEQTVVGYGPGPDLLRGIMPQTLAHTPGSDIERLKQEMFERFLSVEQPPVFRRNALQDELHSFLNAVAGRGRPVVDGRAGLAALELTQRIVESVNRHAWDGCSTGRSGPHVGASDADRRAA